MDNAIHTFENHAQDSRVQDIGDVSPLLGASNANSAGVSGNNPLVVFSKASHARNAAGDGERYEKSEVAQTRNTFDQGETRAQEVVVSGCLNPGDPMTLRVYGEDGANPTLLNGGTGGTIRQGVLVTPEIYKTLSAEGFDVMPDIHKGNGMPVVAIEGNGSRPSHFGTGYNTDGANGHGVAEEATHTIDRASGQAVAVGNPWDTQSQQVLMSTNGVVPPLAANGKTERRHEGADRRAVVIGCDRRNQSDADEVQTALQSTVSDGGSTVAIGVDAYNQSTTGGASEPLGHSATDTDHTPAVALNHIVRRLTPTEAERLQGFPDGWTKIPYRGKPADECPDSPRYKALGNSFATNCCEYVLRRIVAAFRLDMVPEV